MKRSSLLLFLIFNFIAIHSSSIKQLSIEDGLSNRRVFGSAIDMQGYVWFATKTNIDRYDGENFDSYILSNNEKNRGVMSDNNRKIYAFTENSVYVYNDLIDDFELVINLSQRKDYFKSTAITAIHFDSFNYLYITTNNGILAQINNIWFTIPELKNVSIHSIASQQNGTIHVGTVNGLLKFQLKDNRFVKSNNTVFDFFKDKRIQSLYYDKKTNTLWIGTFASGLYIYSFTDPGKLKLVNKLDIPIKKIVQISENEIWIGSDGDGIFIYDRYSNELIKTIKQGETSQDNLGANGIYDILQVKNKVWISTYTAGIYIYNTESVVERKFKHEKYNRNSLIDDHVNVIYQDSDGDLWFGTNKGLSFYNTNNNVWKHYLNVNTKNENENSVILSILEDSKNNIWVGGYATKIVKINKKSGSVSNLENISGFNKAMKSYIYSMELDEEGNIWFGGSVDYLKKYIPSENRIIEYKINGINKILDYNQSTLYIATIKGLYSLNKINGNIKLIDFKTINGGEKLTSYPFLNNIIVDLYDEDILWVGTEGFGLYKVDFGKSEIKVIDINSGLTSNYIYGLLFDNLDRLWISTEYGLDCFDNKTSNISSYYEFDGLTDNTFNFLSYCKLRNGDLMFGTPEGVNLLTPLKITKEKDLDFNLRFKGFYLFYEKIKSKSEKSPLKQSIDETTEIELNYLQHSFSFDFINLNLAKVGRTLYSWKLEGWDDDWSQPSTDHKAVYNNIPSGKYQFMVKAINVDNNDESQIRTIIIKRRPPFWASTIAYVLYFLIIIWLVYFLVKYWLNKVDNKFTLEKIKFFVSMAHEIRTPITLIKAPLNEIDNENLTREGRSALELARKNTDKLLGMVTQLLDFQKIEADAMRLSIEETHLNAFVDNVLSNYKYLAKNKGLDLQKKSEISGDITVWMDRNKVQIMLENLVTNAIKYTEKGGYVNLFVEVKNSKLQLQVSDNGIGIPSKAHSNLFKSVYRAQNAASSVEVGTGIGLMFTKRLVELHKGQITFISSENVGSTFRIEIPIAKANYSTDEIIERKDTEEVAEDHTEDETHQAMHVLLVEDNDELRTYLMKMLRKKYSVAEAANGIEALAVLENDSPDLILSDVLMPEMDGFELCRRVKTNISTCHIPFILLTSLSDREDVMKGLELGADDYITKPFDSIILEGKIKAIFNNRALFRKKYVEKSVTLNESNLLNDLNKTFMKKLVDLVEANITNEEFNIDELSAEMAMSRSVFFKKVKSLTGQNPKEFIRDIKMNKAADLLRDQKYSVSEIAYLIGFPNAKYFSTAFKKYYGTTPSGFIEKEKREDSFGEHLEESDD